MLSSETKFIDASILRYLGTFASAFSTDLEWVSPATVGETTIAMNSQIRACAKHGKWHVSFDLIPA
jgi:hypothetical protein